MACCCIGWAGIAPESKCASETGDAGGTQREQKAVRETLVKAYERNIATRLKAELCAVESNDYGYTREMANAASEFPLALDQCRKLRRLILTYELNSEERTMVYELVGTVHGAIDTEPQGEKA